MNRSITADQLRQRANQWFAAELQRCREAHGPSWPEHEVWILDYLRAELAERLSRWQQ
jgi:hypothetical protein